MDTSFCMESGQIKTGEDKQDTYVKMLQEVVRVTAPVAYGIAVDYPSVVSLVNAMRRHGPSILEDIEVCLRYSPHSEASNTKVDCRNAPTRTGSVQIGRSGPPSVNGCTECSWSWIPHAQTFELECPGVSRP